LVATVAFSIALNLSARAADCSINISACISGNQGKPNAVAKCQAAGQRCTKSGTFVGPFNGQSYQGGKCGRWGCGTDQTSPRSKFMTKSAFVSAAVAGAVLSVSEIPTAQAYVHHRHHHLSYTATTINPTWPVMDHKTVETGAQTAITAAE
jgi:hypothetical protein